MSPYRNKYFFPETYGNYILYAEARSTIGLCKNILAGVTTLIKGLGFHEMFFLGDSTSPWLVREHDYKPVKQALEYLAQHKISRSFNGAIEVDGLHLSVFLMHLFWLVRCNGVVFTPHFSDLGFNVMVNLCQYGNIHFSTLNQQADESFNASVLNAGLQFLNEERCGSYKIQRRMAANR